jgi:replicative DNA helicase
LDILTEGPAEGEVFTVVGRSYVGKSLMATNIMVNNADKGLIFYSLEMPARQALLRMYATWAGVDHQTASAQVRSNSLPRQLETMAEELEHQVIVDKSALSLQEMAVYLEAYDRMFGQRPDAVLIDYLELIGGAKASGDGWTRTEATAGSLKDWAKDEKMPVFLLHQANRTEPVWEEPGQDSARGAGFTESDVVVGMWQPWRNPKLNEAQQQLMRNEVHLNVMKNRVTGRTTAAPIVCTLRSDLRLVDQSAMEAMR